jgi:hypothetical protein
MPACLVIRVHALMHVLHDRGMILFEKMYPTAQDVSFGQQKSSPCPRALSKSGARGPSGMALFNYCNGLVSRVHEVGCAALRCPQAHLPPHPARAQTGVGWGGGSSRVWRCVLKM